MNVWAALPLAICAYTRSIAFRCDTPSVVTVRRFSTQLKMFERLSRASFNDVWSATPEARGRPRFPTRTKNGIHGERAHTHTTPTVPTNATSEENTAIVRQFFWRVMRSPY